MPRQSFLTKAFLTLSCLFSAAILKATPAVILAAQKAPLITSAAQALLLPKDPPKDQFIPVPKFLGPSKDHRFTFGARQPVKTQPSFVGRLSTEVPTELVPTYGPTLPDSCTIATFLATHYCAERLSISQSPLAHTSAAALPYHVSSRFKTNRIAKALVMFYCIDRISTLSHELGHAVVGTLLGGRVEGIHLSLLPFTGASCRFSRLPRTLPELMFLAGPCAGALCAYGIQKLFRDDDIVKDAADSSISSNLCNFIPTHTYSGLRSDGARIIESIARRTDFAPLKKCPTLSPISFTLITELIRLYRQQG